MPSAHGAFWAPAGLEPESKAGPRAGPWVELELGPEPPPKLPQAGLGCGRARNAGVICAPYAVFSHAVVGVTAARLQTPARPPVPAVNSVVRTSPRVGNDRGAAHAGRE